MFHHHGLFSTANLFHLSWALNKSNSVTPSLLTFSDLLHYWSYHCLEECVGPCRCCAPSLSVSVSIMSQWWCGTGEQACGGLGPTLPVQAERAWSQLAGWEPLDHRGLLGSGISWWEETAEACVASALANQHSRHTHMHARRPNLCSPPIIPSSFFFQAAGVRHPQRPGPTKVRGGGEGTKALWSAWSKLTGLLSHHWCWFKLIMCEKKKKLPGKLMSCHFVFSIFTLKVQELVFPLFTLEPVHPPASQTTFRYQKTARLSYAIALTFMPCRRWLGAFRSRLTTRGSCWYFPTKSIHSKPGLT